jgi:hypothetical protein
MEPVVVTPNASMTAAAGLGWPTERLDPSDRLVQDRRGGSDAQAGKGVESESEHELEAEAELAADARTGLGWPSGDGDLQPEPESRHVDERGQS